MSVASSQLHTLLPRESLLWIFAAQFVVLLPQFAHLPLWLVGAWCLAVYWRLEVFRGRREIPGRLVKLIAVILAVAGLALTYRRWFALEPMVALLAVSFTLKNIELVSRRDALLSLMLAYFLAATLFVFEQTIPYALYGLLCVVVITAALVAQQGRGSARPRRALGMSARLLAQAVPVMLLLFLVIPRIGPLWAVPQNAAKATTGISDSMSPGEFSQLSKSAKPALRIAFDGSVPPPEQRYWRGLVYTHFDGRRWSEPGLNEGFSGWGRGRRGRMHAADDNATLPAVGPRYRYRIIQEPTQSPWLFALARPDSETRGVWETPDDTLIYKMPVANRLAYEVRSWPREGISANDPLDRREMRRNLQLPSSGNPLARQWAAERRAQGLQPEQISQALLDLYQQRFTYTLRPPELGADSVDEFLFGTREGFCEHFASSYVFTMRAAGVPARVVAGYQGGEWVEQEEYLLVREYDAHAWAEIWLPERGWVRVDPTAAVSPERIRDGLQSAAADEFMEDALLPLHKFGLVSRLRLQWDMINYRWYETVVSFDNERQQGVLQRLLGEISPLRLALFVAAPIALALVVLLFWLNISSRGPRIPAVSRLYLRFCRRMARAGLARNPGETPGEFARRVAREQPRLGPMAAHITAAYEKAAYGGDPAAEKQLRRLVRRFWPMRMVR
ncbi:transglutaminase TgpA family protein [Microbulbifer sp. SA54]|uniref:transglutaminase TgpA family protein n=1 Tax=Microbulbifer sp. SA54 TaxID=3401577 RepID=UPI003AB07618